MNKERHTLFMSKRAWKSVEDNYKRDGCGTKNEFIEKAVHFYCGYLAADDASEYLPTVLSAVLVGSLESMKVKLGRLLFKQAVENNITNHLISFDSDIDIPTYEKLRARSVREVKETNGEISFLDDLKFQKMV